MKDIEKIQSPDLGCQIQAANPANFAIEQEVAALVGATVPQPTEPSADDARELGAQLLVFLRRALTPIQTALRTALAAIYAHLDSRCTDYTPAAYDPFRLPAGPYDPMRPFVPRTLPNLLTALTAFSARKISNGSATNDGIPDGTSLAHLLCSAASSDVTKLIDDNHGWTMIRTLPTLGAYTHILLGCKYMSGNIKINNLSALQSLKFPELVSISFSGVPGPSYYEYYGFFRLLDAVTELEFPMLEVVTIGGYGSFISEMPLVAKLSFPKFKEWRGTWTGGLVYNMAGLTELEVPELTYVGGGGAGRQSFVIDCPNLARALVGPGFIGSYGSVFSGCTALIDLEFSKEVTTSQNLTGWNPTDKGTTFLQNFKEHIALRLTANGSGLTLTLSQAVFDTIWNQDGTPKSTDPDSVIYQINKIIKTDKHWSVNRA